MTVKLLTAEQVAEMLGVSVKFVRAHTTQREPIIPSFKLGKLRKYRADEIERWLAAQSISPAAERTAKRD